MSNNTTTNIVVIIIIIFFGLAIFGFVKIDEAEKIRGNADYIIAPKTHTCSDEEMKKVESETLFCSKNTGYFTSYCYGSAIMRNCQKNTQPKE